MLSQVDISRHIDIVQLDIDDCLNTDIVKHRPHMTVSCYSTSVSTLDHSYFQFNFIYTVD
mgnify:FL=1